MIPQRRSYEPGHTPKCLVLVDETPECDRAVYYASRWAERVHGGVVMLHVINTADHNQQWRGIADIMRAEAQEEADIALDRASGRANGLSSIAPERLMREGTDPCEEILHAIADDADIALLVLAASTRPDGPGPIVTAITRTAGSFPIPLIVVPGYLSDAEIGALS